MTKDELFLAIVNDTAGWKAALNSMWTCLNQDEKAKATALAGSTSTGGAGACCDQVQNIVLASFCLPPEVLPCCGDSLVELSFVAGAPIGEFPPDNAVVTFVNNCPDSDIIITGAYGLSEFNTITLVTGSFPVTLTPTDTVDFDLYTPDTLGGIYDKEFYLELSCQVDDLSYTTPLAP